MTAENHAALRAEVKEFLASEDFVPRCDSWLVGADPEFSRKLARRGLVGSTVPEEYGGRALRPLDRFVVVEELLAAGAPVAAHWITERQIAPALLRYGTPEQRQEWLPRIVRAEAFFAIGLSEPEAGSDLAAVRTRARPVDGGWRISGTKLWSSGAHLAHAVVVLARTEAGNRRHEGLSQLIVRLPSPGVEISPIRSMSGEHHFNQIVLDDAFVPDSDVLGTVGEGWRQVVGELAFERSGPERFLSTMPALDRLVTRLGTDHDRAVQEAVGGAVAALVTLRTLSLGVAAELDRGEVPAVAAAMVKDLGTRFERASVPLAERLGRELSIPDPEVDRLVADAALQAPGFTVRGGAVEVLRNIIAKELVV